MRNLQIIFFQSLRLLLSERILYTTLFSFLLSFIFLMFLLLCFWNLLPSISWAKNLFFGIYDYLFNYFWFFIISSAFIYLFPSISTIISGFFLENIVDNVNKSLGVYAEFKFEGDGFLGGIIAGVRILGFSTIIFLVILILKWFFISSIIISILIQFLASSYIIGREYYEIVSIKYFPLEESIRFKRKNFLNIFIVGIICNLIFILPIINLFAPTLSTIFMTLRFNQLKLSSS